MLPVLDSALGARDAVGEAPPTERGTLHDWQRVLERVVEENPVAVLLVDGGDRVVLANRAAREILALGGGHLAGRGFSTLLANCPPALRETLLAGADAVLTQGCGGVEEVFQVTRHRVTLGAWPHDLYLLERLTAELRRQEVEVWKQAIRTLGHELDNSLAPIASLARSASEILELPEQRERLPGLLGLIRERAAHLREFLEGYARFARLPHPVKQPIAWGAFLADLGALYPFRLEGAPPARPGLGDPGQVQQALINVLKNAHESGGPPAEVAVALAATADGGVRIRVSDRGAGMTDEQLRRALLPFYSSKPGGSGLGLPLAREILEAHGGHLRIERRAGGGTAVVCWLPAA